MTRTASLIVLFLSAAAAASAHHGGGTFDSSRAVTYTGVLTRIDLVNPHAWVYFNVTDANGKVGAFRCEMRAASVLRRSGWTKEMFKAGQKVTIEGSPDKFDREFLLSQHHRSRGRQPHGPLRAVQQGARGARDHRRGGGGARSRDGRPASRTSPATGRPSSW